MLLVVDFWGRCWLLVWDCVCLGFCDLVLICGGNLLVSVVIVCFDCCVW